MTQQLQTSMCKECEKQTLIQCHFCHEFICHDHAHYITIPHHSINGVSNRSLVLCELCKPHV